jgi:hypothetical protein
MKLIAQVRYHDPQGDKAPARHLNQFVSSNYTVALKKFEHQVHFGLGQADGLRSYGNFHPLRYQRELHASLRLADSLFGLRPSKVFPQICGEALDRFKELLYAAKACPDAADCGINLVQPTPVGGAHQGSLRHPNENWSLDLGQPIQQFRL